jgi:hypothetical protein
LTIAPQEKTSGWQGRFRSLSLSPFKAEFNGRIEAVFRNILMAI